MQIEDTGVALLTADSPRAAVPDGCAAGTCAVPAAALASVSERDTGWPGRNAGRGAAAAAGTGLAGAAGARSATATSARCRARAALVADRGAARRAAVSRQPAQRHAGVTAIDFTYTN